MEFSTLLHECKEILLRILHANEKRFEISPQSQRLIHKCSVFSAPLHTITESEANVVFLKKLKGALLATAEFIDNSNVVVNTSGRSPVSAISSAVPQFSERAIQNYEKSAVDVNYTNLCIRIAHVAHDFESSLAPSSDQDLLIEDCLELVNHIMHVNATQSINPDDTRNFIQSCHVFTELLHSLGDSPATFDELTSFRETMTETMDFIASYSRSSIIGEASYISHRSSYDRTVDQLLFRIAKHTHRLEELVPSRAQRLLPFSTHTVAFDSLRKECKELQRHIIQADDARFVNPADCRQLIHACRLLGQPLSDVVESVSTLVALHELHASLTNVKSFLETYASSSVLGETVFMATRSIYDKAWEELMVSLGHDLHVLQHACAVQKASIQFHTAVRDCQSQLSDVLQIGNTVTAVNERDLFLVLQSARSFVNLLHNCKESEATSEALVTLKYVLLEVLTFIELFEARDDSRVVVRGADSSEFTGDDCTSGDSSNKTTTVVSLAEYSRDLTVVLAKMSDCAQSFNAAFLEYSGTDTTASTADAVTSAAASARSSHGMAPLPKSLYPQSSRSQEYASSRGWSRSSNCGSDSRSDSRSSTPVDNIVSGSAV